MKKLSLKRIENYRLVIVDMDGTLYYQKPLRMYMFKQLLAHIFRNGWKGFKDVLVIYRFRRLRENKGLTLEVACRNLSERYDCSYEDIREIIDEWIFRLPLNGIPLFRDDILCDSLRVLMKNECTVTILSDYPAVDKCRALGLSCIPSFCSEQKEIGELKPSPKGIQYIMQIYGISNPSEVLVIGDRESRDGKSAIFAGCD
ncbi:MAG: HAD family hydrolase, partial [Butyrivibrio sp.]|nr:HAD family hydrolase [Butyrivibrio sp.]